MLAPTLSLVAREVVGNDDVARAQRRAQKGFDPRQKQGALSGAAEEINVFNKARRTHAIRPRAMSNCSRNILIIS